MSSVRYIIANMFDPVCKYNFTSYALLSLLCDTIALCLSEGRTHDAGIACRLQYSYQFASFCLFPKWPPNFCLWRSRLSSSRPLASTWMYLWALLECQSNGCLETLSIISSLLTLRKILKSAWVVLERCTLFSLLNVSQQIVASTKEHVFMVIKLCRFPQRQKRLRNRFNVSKSMKQLKITL